MPRITSRFVLGPVEPKLSPGTKPAKSLRSRALIWSKVPEVSAVMLLGTFWMDSDRRVAVTMTSASSVPAVVLADTALCAIEGGLHNEVTAPASATHTKRNEAIQPPDLNRPIRSRR